MTSETLLSRKNCSASDKASRLSALAVGGWSMFELPWEWVFGASRLQAFSLVVSKLLVLTLAVLAARGLRTGRALLSLLCAASLMAILPSLPYMFNTSPDLFVLALLECLLKSLFFILTAFAYSFEPKCNKAEHDVQFAPPHGVATLASQDTACMETEGLVALGANSNVPAIAAWSREGPGVTRTSL